MTLIQSKIKGFLSLCIAATFFVACNSNQSANKVADTTTAASTNLSPDTTQMATTPENTQSAAPSNATTATEAPATKTQPTSSSNTVTKTRNVVVNRKIRAIVEVVPVPKHPKVKMDKTGVYEYSEVSPSYPGGQLAIEAYLNDHIEYPQTALDNNKEGRMGVSFIVNENGRVTNAHVTGNKLSKGLDEEAVRAVESMPNWRPGMVKGKPVRTRVTLPITFRMEG